MSRTLSSPRGILAAAFASTLILALQACHGGTTPQQAISQAAYARVLVNGHYVPVPVFETTDRAREAHLNPGQPYMVRHAPPPGLELASNANLIGRRIKIAPGVFEFSGTISYFDPQVVARGAAKWCRLEHDRMLCFVGKGRRLNIWEQQPGRRERTIITIDPSALRSLSHGQSR